MTYSQLFAVLKDSGLSPEQAARKIGVSGMTLRRWQARPGGAALDKVYEPAVETAVHQWVSEGVLSRERPSVRAVIEGSSALSFETTLKSLGFSTSLLKTSGDPSEALMVGLSGIGGDASRQREVEEGKKKIFSFAKMGADWKERISGLWKVLESDKLTLLDKLVAYGALFYLLTPFDLIPDYIPVIGLLDDYAVLGLALVYYARRYPHLFKKAH